MKKYILGLLLLLSTQAFCNDTTLIKILVSDKKLKDIPHYGEGEEALYLDTVNATQFGLLYWIIGYRIEDTYYDFLDKEVDMSDKRLWREQKRTIFSKKSSFAEQLAAAIN